MSTLSFVRGARSTLSPRFAVASSLPVSRKAVAFLRREAPDWLARVRVSKGQEVRYQFWQKGGGYDRNITEPATLLKMIDYIHLNPVRRGLVERAADWT